MGSVGLKNKGWRASCRRDTVQAGDTGGLQLLLGF